MALNDINQMFSIVDPKTGKPTEYLMRLLRDRGIDAENIEDVVANNSELLTILQASVDAINGTVFNALTGLAGGGTLGTDDPIDYSLDADIDDLNDVDTTTTPPTAGQALVWNDTDSLWNPGDVASGGGGGGGSMELIEQWVATGGETSHDFTGIPSGYTYLRLVCEVGATTDTDGRIRFNSNTGSNYQFLRHWGGNSHSDSIDLSATSFDDIYKINGATASRRGILEMNIYSYDDATLFTNFIGNSAPWDDDNLVVTSGGLYEVAETVDEINFFLASGTIRAGSKITLYGMN